MAQQNIKIPMPLWGKALIGIGVGLTALAIFYVVKRNIGNIKKNIDAKKEVNATDDVAKKLTSSGQKPTLDNFKLSQIANQIFVACDGYGHDVNAIYRAFANVNNDLDVINLIKAFGIREISTGALNPAPNLKGTLSQVITDELSAEEVRALNDMLARKGIKYRF